MNNERQKENVLHESALIEAIQNGLPLVSRPYAALGRRLGLSEAEVIKAIADLIAGGVIKRFGVVVRHRALGYVANAMVVWDIPDDQVDAYGHQFSAYDFVTLCYRRPRRPPDWPYNLFCMIHGRQREQVRSQIRQLIENTESADIPHAILFSRRCFKQRGARYTDLAQRDN